MRNLIVQYYLDRDLNRQKEIDTCVKYNAQNIHLDRIILVVEHRDVNSCDILRQHLSPEENKKIIVFQVDKRPTYKDLFQIANRYVQGNDISIIANSDIYFNGTLQLVTSEALGHGSRAFALSRYEVMEHSRNDHLLKLDYGVKVQLLDNIRSQDCWMICGQIKISDNCDFCLGKPNCDNRIAYELQSVGYEVSNPSKTIVTIHLHQTQIRNYQNSEIVLGNKIAVLPINLYEVDDPNVVKSWHHESIDMTIYYNIVLFFIVWVTVIVLLIYYLDY